RYDNGSVIVVGGMDKATKIMSSEYDLVFADEATELTVDDWEAITSRLRHGRLSFQQLLAACNPDAPTHWLKQRCDKGLTRLINTRHEDNPVYYNPDGTLTERGRDYIGKLDRLTGVRHARLRRGVWAAAEGMVYSDYQDAVHVVDPFPIPDHWTRYLAVDFGYTNPFVAQWWAEDPDGRLYLYREIYHTRRTVDQHARDILDQVTTPDEPSTSTPETSSTRSPHRMAAGWSPARPRSCVIMTLRGVPCWSVNSAWKPRPRTRACLMGFRQCRPGCG